MKLSRGNTICIPVSKSKSRNFCKQKTVRQGRGTIPSTHSLVVELLDCSCLLLLLLLLLASVHHHVFADCGRKKKRKKVGSQFFASRLFLVCCPKKLGV